MQGIKKNTTKKVTGKISKKKNKKTSPCLLKKVLTCNLVSIEDVSFLFFPGKQIEQASNQISALGVSKKWKEVGRR